MLVFVEGPDGTGKTTLINNICSAKNVKHIFGIHKDAPRQYLLWKCLIETCVESDEIFIVDRCFISDWAYRVAVKDGKPYMSFSEMCTLLQLDTKNVVYVFCNNDNAYINAVERGEDYICDECVHDRLTGCYDFIADTLKNYCGCKVLRFDFAKDNIYSLYKDIVGVI